jgi:hypothetical protein
VLNSAVFIEYIVRLFRENSPFSLERVTIVKKIVKKDCEEELLIKHYDYVLISDHFIEHTV